MQCLWKNTTLDWILSEEQVDVEKIFIKIFRCRDSGFDMGIPITPQKIYKNF